MITALRAGLLALAAASLAPAAFVAPAEAQSIRVRTVRMPAADPIKLADFYKAAFGMSEVRRLEFPTLKEVILNTGKTQAEAAASANTPIVLMTRPAAMKEAPPLAYLIMGVTDMDKSIEAVKAAGGTVFRPVAKLADGTTYAFVKDPEGNQVELLLEKR